MFKVASPCSLRHRGGGREADGEFISGLLNSAVALETGLRRWIRSTCSCSATSLSSMMLCSGATAPSGALGRQWSMACLACFILDRSGRTAALQSSDVIIRRLLFFLRAMMPKERQIGLGSASVSYISGMRRSNDEASIPSGCGCDPMMVSSIQC